MSTKRIGTLCIIALTTTLFAFVGCSDQNITGSSESAQSIDRQNSFAGDDNTTSATSVELADRVASIDVDGRIIELVNSGTTVEVLTGAEVVLKADGNETPISLADIMVGDSVEVRGDMSGTTLLADRVRVRVDDNPENEQEIGGRVETIDPAARTITLVGNPTPIDVLPTAEVVAKNSGMETPIELSEISIGDSLDIRGNLQPDGRLAADRVRLRLGGDDFASQLEIESIITSIDYAAGTFTVASRSETITVDDATFIFTQETSRGPSSNALSDDDDEDDDNRPKQRLEFSNLAVGDSVEIYANVIDASTLYAVAIELEDGDHIEGMEMQFKDVIASIDLTSGLVTFENRPDGGTVVDGAELAGLNNEPLTLSDFTVGNLVEVKGFKNSDGGLDIVRMHKEDSF